MFITPSFKKSLIVEQFQGNYLKRANFDHENRQSVHFEVQLVPSFCVPYNTNAHRFPANDARILRQRPSFQTVLCLVRITRANFDHENRQSVHFEVLSLRRLERVFSCTRARNLHTP